MGLWTLCGLLSILYWLMLELQCWNCDVDISSIVLSRRLNMCLSRS